MTFQRKSVSVTLSRSVTFLTRRITVAKSSTGVAEEMATISKPGKNVRDFVEEIHLQKVNGRIS